MKTEKSRLQTFDLTNIFKNFKLDENKRHTLGAKGFTPEEIAKEADMTLLQTQKYIGSCVNNGRRNFELLGLKSYEKMLR